MRPERWAWPWLAAAIGLLAAGCDGKRTAYMGAEAAFAGCVTPSSPPASMGLDPFYARYLDANGIPVLSSVLVSDEALIRACRIAGDMTSARPDVRQVLAAKHLRIAVLGSNERTTDIPEYADLPGAFPGTDWNAKRGLGATQERPVCSAGEENLLCSPGDVAAGESTLIWLLADTLRDMGIGDVDAQFAGELETAYAAAMSRGLWAGTDAVADVRAYWASGALVWYSAGAGDPVNNRADLTAYDPELASLLAEYLPAREWDPSCY